MSLLYLTCLLPLFIGLIVYFISHKIEWWEWLIGAASAFLLAGIIHLVSYHSQVNDFEILSGRVVQSRMYSEWTEQYQEAIYRDKTVRNSDGSYTTTREFSHYETRYQKHNEYFNINTSLNTTHRITKPKFEYFKNTFNNIKPVKGDRTTFKTGSTMVSGDPYDYVTISPYDVVEPIHVPKSFKNRLKASKTVFSTSEIPSYLKSELHEYPPAGDIFKSNRVLGKARQSISTKEWDVLNAQVGPLVGVNLIIVGFNSSDSMLAEWQRAKWVGGKKNDLIICYGTNWVSVFGWSDGELCKRKLEALFVNNEVSNSLIPEIKKIVLENYIKTDWSKFDYISINPTKTHWIVFLSLMMCIQGGLYFWFHSNEFDKMI